MTTVTAPPTSFEPTFSPTTVDSYNPQGFLTSRVARPTSTETLTETYAYDTTGNRTVVTDPRVATTEFCYDRSHAGATIAGSRGNLTRIIGPAPVAGANRPVTLIAYDAKSNVTQTVAPAGVPSGLTVTCATNLAAVDADFATDLAYDAAGATLVSTTSRYTDPDTGATSAVTKYEYGDAVNPGHVTRIIPPRGNTTATPDSTYATTMTYFGTGSRAGLLASASDALGNTTTYDYDPVGRLASSVGPLGNAPGGVPAEHRTEVTYDREDRVQLVKLPAPVAGGAQLVSETRYDEVGNPIVRIDAKGQVTVSTYDERDALRQVKESPNAWTDPALPPTGIITTEYSYDAAGQMTRLSRAKGDATFERVTDYTYDGRGLVRRETQYPAWPTTTPTLVATSAYDPNGNLAVATDQLGRTTTMAHDFLNRPTALDYSDPATPDVAYGYDPNNNRTSMTDGTGASSYVYDELDRLTSVTTPGPKTVAYRYDRDGNRTKLIYPDATAVTYAFDKASLMSGLTDWASRTVGYTYFADGALKDATNPNGTVASYAYDNARRLTDITHKLGTTVFERRTYKLDGIGNILRVASGDVDAQTARPDGFVAAHGTWTGTYASVNETIANDATFLASPGSPVAANFYEVSLADALVPFDKTSVTLRYRYAKSGNNAGKTINLTVELRQGSTVIASRAHANVPGVSGSGWQQASLLLTIAEANAITNYPDVRVRFRPTASGNGQARQAQISWSEFGLSGPDDPATAATYGYDRLDRLTGVTGPDGPRSYTIDPVGNRASRALAGTTTTYTYDRADRITAAGATAMTVNAAGATTARGTDTFTYDGANRLTSATVASVTETSTYDGDGIRFSRQVGAGPVTRAVTDPTAGLPVTLDDGSRKYVWGMGLAYAVSGSAIEVQHADRLGSVRAVTNGTEAVIATYRTDEFGIPTASIGSAGSPFRYTGEPLDASGLTYLRARYYDPTLGRFMSRDPFAGFASSPLSLNRYSYVGNNPATWSDPSGFSPSSKVLSCGGEAHGALDLGGLVFPPSDIANAGIYLCEGDPGNAALSGIAFVPVIGDLLKWLGKSLRIGSKAFVISPKIAHQMTTRGWTQEAIEEAMKTGVQVKAVNKANGNLATRYIHPTTGQSVVVDNVTGAVIQVGAPGFRHGAGSGDLE